MRGTTRLALTMVAALLLVLGACSGDDEAPVEELPEQLRSAIEDPFEFLEHDGATYAVGHRLALQVDPTWHIYDPESLALDGTTWDWAAGQPEDDTGIPTYMSVYAGVPGQSHSFDRVRDQALQTAERQDGFHLVEEGDADVPGAHRSEFIRWTREVDYRERTRGVEEVTVFIEVQPEVTTTVRFFAPEGAWDEHWEEFRGSLRVSP